MGANEFVKHIKLVISDIDGTLVTGTGVISPATRREITRIMAAGVHFGVASGRPTPRVRDVLEGLGVTIPIISSNGAIIEDLATGEIVHSRHLEHVLARQALAIIADYNIRCSFIDTAAGWCYWTGSRDLPDRLAWVVAELEATRIEDLDRFFAGAPVVRKIVVAGDERELARLEATVASLDGVFVTSSWQGNREILVAGADKANAAKILAARLEIDSEQVLAIGDHRNDLELITWAGTGVAMGNAEPELKAVADWVTASNEEDGVALALERFVPR